MIPINSKYPYIASSESRQGGRQENQDYCWGGDTKLGFLLLVCDGMGGGPGGKLASSTAVTSIVKYIEETTCFDEKEALKNAILAANKALRDAVAEDESLAGMGTTVVAMLINAKMAYIAHVGDSRCYQFRSRSKLFCTQDHSKVAEMVRDGALTEEQARLSAYSNIITRALGTNDNCVVDIDERPYEKGDRFVLCSDGVWGSMNEKDLNKLLTSTPSVNGTVESVAISVDEIGFASGGYHDNHTVIIVDTKQNSLIKEQMSKKTKLLLQILSALLAVSVLANIMQYCHNSHNNNLASTQVSSQDTVAKPRASSSGIAGVMTTHSSQKAKPSDETLAKDQLVDKIDAYIVNLQEISVEGKGDDKRMKRDLLVSELSQLNDSFEQYGLQDNLKRCIDELKKPISIDDPSVSEGQYNQIIKWLKEMREVVQNR